MKIQTYEDAEVSIMEATEHPSELINTAMRLTMTQQIGYQGEINTKSLKFLCDAEHTSLLEHASITFALEGVSRSFLAQVTRHRVGSFTSASQHYADYRDMPMVIHPSLIDNTSLTSELTSAVRTYKYLINTYNVKLEEARQVLPNACAVNLIWTVNLRALMNFLALRLCKRNVDEMRIIARKVHEELYRYWSEFAELCGPVCFTRGKCTQGRMSCGEPRKRSSA